MDLIEWAARIESLAADLADDARAYAATNANIRDALANAVNASTSLTAALRGYIAALDTPSVKDAREIPEWVSAFRGVLTDLVEDAVTKIGVAQRHPLRMHTQLRCNQLYASIVDALGDELLLGDTIFND